MKKLYYLIIIVLISSLVLVGCSLLSNISQVPTTNQSEVSSIVKNSNNTNMKCVDFEGTELNKGDSVEGMGTVHPLLNIQLEGAVDTDLVLIEKGTGDISNVAYYAGAGIANGCLNGTYGFGCPAFNSSGARINRLDDNDKIIFEFPDGITVSNFSVEMFDYGDFYPLGSGDRLVTLKAYSDSVDEITYSGPANVDLIYDACHSSGNGIHKFEISKSGIYKIELVFGTGIDPAIGFDDICFTLEVPIDIKPQSCPNPLNVKSQGVLPVAILGTDYFDVNNVDPSSVLLEEVSPVKWAFEDVATPYEPTGITDCLDCSTAGLDGFLDLILHFNTQDIINVLESENSSAGDIDLLDIVTISAISDGECVVLTLSGRLIDGTPIKGEDSVVILKKGKP